MISSCSFASFVVNPFYAKNKVFKVKRPVKQNAKSISKLANPLRKLREQSANCEINPQIAESKSKLENSFRKLKNESAKRGNNPQIAERIRKLENDAENCKMTLQTVFLAGQA